MIENIRLSFKGIWAHKMRSALTMLGIVIGIASIIAIISLIQSVAEQVKDQYNYTGDNTVSVDLYMSSDGYDTPAESESIEGISEIPKDILEQAAKTDGVVNVSPFYASHNSSVSYNTEVMTNLYGVDTEYFEMKKYYLTKGRLLTQKDYDNKNNVAVIEEFVASSLFKGEDPIGKTIDIQGEPFVVVGVVDKSYDYDKINTVDDYNNYIGYKNLNNNVFVPSTSWPQIMFFDGIQSLLIEVVDIEKADPISDAVAKKLNENIQVSDDYTYKSSTSVNNGSSLDDILNMIKVLLTSIAGISLVVGGIGVMNIMLVSVTERTREIGLKKAIGAKRSQIVGQFLTEAAALTGVGGIVGVILGIITAFIIGSLSNTSIVISFTSVIVSVVFSMAIGIVFGIMPSIKASRLDPIEALRYE